MCKERRRSCVPAHTGYNEAAANATRKAVKDFVRTVFKLEELRAFGGQSTISSVAIIEPRNEIVL